MTGLCFVDWLLDCLLLVSSIVVAVLLDCFCCLWVQASSEAQSARQEAARARVSANSAQAGMMKQLNEQVGAARGEQNLPLSFAC